MVNLPCKLQTRDLISALCQLLFSSMLHSVHCPSIAFFEVPRKNTPQLRLMESCMCRTTLKNTAWPPDSLILSHYHWNRQTYWVSSAFPEKVGIFLKMALLKGDRECCEWALHSNSSWKVPTPTNGMVLVASQSNSPIISEGFWTVCISSNGPCVGCPTADTAIRPSTIFWGVEKFGIIKFVSGMGAAPSVPFWNIYRSAVMSQ